jgi:hypothetical protein
MCVRYGINDYVMKVYVNLYCLHEAAMGWIEGEWRRSRKESFLLKMDFRLPSTSSANAASKFLTLN